MTITRHGKPVAALVSVEAAAIGGRLEAKALAAGHDPFRFTVPLRAALCLRISTVRQAEYDVSIPNRKWRGEVRIMGSKSTCFRRW
ncbi:hypothetical protein FACS1894205_2690 [Alphaproteobacteria bacterium]|nr:hypothetical protein FACS1894205_2690 [Alphaproteobacteria bacterium]